MGLPRWFCGKSCKFYLQLSFTFSFFLVELIVGFTSNSLALVADAFHMFSDVISLAVGLASIRMSKKSSKKNTFGWARAEILGALVNAVFLVALCFNIFVEAVKRFFEAESITDPKLVLITGAVGLFINIVGMLLFGHGGHGHSHGGGHSHSAHSHEIKSSSISQTFYQHMHELNFDDSTTRTGKELNDESTLPEIEKVQPSTVDKKNAHVPKSSQQMNMRGVFLHLLGDALGSVVVIVSATIVWLIDADWTKYIDPSMSVFMVIIILCTAVPLLKDAAHILLQTVPKHIEVHELEMRLMKEVEGVIDVHEFHVWQLTGERIIATAHIACENIGHYERISGEVKEFFHREGIHSTTVQPEFHHPEAKSERRACLLECGPDKSCSQNTCCPQPNGRTKNGTILSNVVTDGAEIRQRSGATTDVHNGTVNDINIKTFL